MPVVGRAGRLESGEEFFFGDAVPFAHVIQYAAEGSLGQHFVRRDGHTVLPCRRGLPELNVASLCADDLIAESPQQRDYAVTVGLEAAGAASWISVSVRISRLSVSPICIWSWKWQAAASFTSDASSSSDGAQVNMSAPIPRAHHCSPSLYTSTLTTVSDYGAYAELVKDNPGTQPLTACDPLAEDGYRSVFAVVPREAGRAHSALLDG